MTFTSAEARRAWQRRRYRERHDAMLAEGARRRADPAYRERMRAYSRDYYRRNRREIKSRELEKKYGITLDAYEALLASQGGVCAICGRPPRRPMVDHDHLTNAVRGVLCSECNLALGKLHDDVESLRRAIAYLERRAE